VSEFDFQGSTASHVRFIMTGGKTYYSGDYDITGGPLIYRKGTGWSAYSVNTKTWDANCYSGLAGTTESVMNYFAGKTVKIYIDSAGHATLYTDGENLGTTSVIFGTDGARMAIGNHGTPSNINQDPALVGAQLYNVTITGARVYHGFKE
jgi:hypothetical protein